MLAAGSDRRQLAPWDNWATVAVGPLIQARRDADSRVRREAAGVVRSMSCFVSKTSYECC